MVARQESSPRTGLTDAPAEFRAAVQHMRTARMRPEVHCEEMPAPQRIAPWSSALSADVTLEDEEVGTGRLILLHDPAGNDIWEGEFRCVAYARATVDSYQAIDPLLGEVGWSWLIEALDSHDAAYTAPSGSVTRVVTEGFGSMAEDEPTAQIEIRASWTPIRDDEDTLRISSHVEAWGELLCTATGLPPVPEGVTAIPSRRGQRGR